jgi:hypothetical protein
MPLNKVRVQNLRDFTVQIRHIQSQDIIGTGFVVSDDGKIVTCAHVVRVTSIEQTVAEGVAVGIYFPQVKDKTQKFHTATVIAHFSDHHDDVALLQIEGKVLPPGVKVAVLGNASDSIGSKFKSFGYRCLSNYQGLPAEGEIVDFAEQPFDRVLQADPLLLSSQHIDSGMSGGAVLDVQRDLVVGVIAETWDSPRGFKDKDTSFAVDGIVLAISPLNLFIQNESHLECRTHNEINGNTLSTNEMTAVRTIVLNNAPTSVLEWVGRQELISAINTDWVDPQHLITGLIGFGGEGKSSLARRWMDELISDKATLPQPQGVFWWCFNDKQNIDHFFDAILTFLDKRIDPQKLGSASFKIVVIFSILKNTENTERHLFVLDGLEIFQNQSGDDYGLLKNDDLRKFLQEFAAGEHKSFCLITSRIHLLDLLDYTTYTHRDIEQLSKSNGRQLLHKLGVKGNDIQLEKIVKDWSGHALTISLLGTYLVTHFNGDATCINNIPSPTTQDSFDNRVHRVLQYYDKYLTEAERRFMRGFCTLGIPVTEEVLESLIPLDKALLKRLITYRILRYNPQNHEYSTHPLIRSYYCGESDDPSSGDTALDERIQEYFVSIDVYESDHPTETSQPLIEKNIQFRTNQLIENRLKDELIAKDELIGANPGALFAWEPEIPSDCESSIWVPQLNKLRINKTLPKQVLIRLFEKSQEVVQSSFREGMRLVHAIEELFVGQNSQELYNIAKLVVQSNYRSGGLITDELETDELEIDYETALPQQQILLSLLAAKELIDSLTISVSPEQTFAKHQWMTHFGSLTIEVRYQLEDVPALQITGQLPCEGYLELQVEPAPVIIECLSSGKFKYELLNPQSNQTYPLKVQPGEQNLYPLTFAIQTIATEQFENLNYLKL